MSYVTLKILPMSDQSDRLALPTKGYDMATIEFSDGFDAVGWYMEQMRRDEDYDYYHDWE